MKKLILLIILITIAGCNYTPPQYNPYYKESEGAYNKRFYRNDYKK